MAITTSSIPREIVADGVTLEQLDSMLGIKDQGVSERKVTPNIIPPIGSIIPWLKNLDGTPELPDGWVECNGQTIDDPESPYYGKQVPNLNGEHRFLRGNSTSGGTGESETHTHSVSLPKNPASENDADYNGSRSWYFAHNATVTSGSASNLPPYYDVVWIIRIK